MLDLHSLRRRWNTWKMKLTMLQNHKMQIDRAIVIYNLSLVGKFYCQWTRSLTQKKEIEVTIKQIQNIRVKNIFRHLLLLYRSDVRYSKYLKKRCLKKWLKMKKIQMVLGRVKIKQNKQLKMCMQVWSSNIKSEQALVDKHRSKLIHKQLYETWCLWTSEYNMKLIENVKMNDATKHYQITLKKKVFCHISS
eukprot:UN28847